MLASQLFYSELVVKNIEPYLRNSSSANSTINLERFPLLFTQAKYKPEDFKFYQKYLVPSLHAHCFAKTLEVLSQPHLDDASLFTDAIEPTLVKKIKQRLSANRAYLELSSVRIRSTKVLEKSTFQGVFMHRALNMPKQCYSVEKMSQTNIVLRMRNKMTREEHISQLIQKQKAYNENNYKLEKYYMDGYENFIQREQVIRVLVEVNAEIKGKMIIPEKAERKLPLDETQPITSHLLQIESIKVPGRLATSTALVTDIDYFMQGNPYTL